MREGKGVHRQTLTVTLQCHVGRIQLQCVPHTPVHLRFVPPAKGRAAMAAACSALSGSSTGLYRQCAGLARCCGGCHSLQKRPSWRHRQRQHPTGLCAAVRNSPPPFGGRRAAAARAGLAV